MSLWSLCKNKGGVTLIKMCNQWQNSFDKMESRYTRLVSTITNFGIKADSIIEE